MAKYEVKILKKEGTCDDSLFEKMAKKGDLNAVKVTEVLGMEVEILGYAACEIETEEKTFKMYYFDTAEYGLISSGSEIFYNSVIDYLEDTKIMIIKEIKTKRGKTYKVQPRLIKKETKNNEE